MLYIWLETCLLKKQKLFGSYAVMHSDFIVPLAQNVKSSLGKGSHPVCNVDTSSDLQLVRGVFTYSLFSVLPKVQQDSSFHSSFLVCL